MEISIHSRTSHSCKILINHCTIAIFDMQTSTIQNTNTHLSLSALKSGSFKSITNITSSLPVSTISLILLPVTSGNAEYLSPFIQFCNDDIVATPFGAAK